MKTYYQGRLSVIKELEEFCEKQLEPIQNFYDTEDNKYKKCTQKGLIRAYDRMLEKLTTKRKRMLNK